MDDAAITAIQTDLKQFKGDPKQLALLRLAEVLTVDPPSAAPTVVAAVEAGWTHEEVAEAIFVVSQFNMMTRIAVAFALPPDDIHPFSADDRLPMLTCGDQ